MGTVVTVVGALVGLAVLGIAAQKAGQVKARQTRPVPVRTDDVERYLERQRRR